MNFQPLKYIYKSSGNHEASTLLLLHGTGGNENDLIPLAKNFGDNFNILSVRGNVLEQGMPRFFKRLAMGVFDEKDLQFRTHELVHFVKGVAHKEGFDLKKLIALGYSNGANISGSLLIQKGEGYTFYWSSIRNFIRIQRKQSFKYRARNQFDNPRRIP